MTAPDIAHWIGFGIMCVVVIWAIVVAVREGPGPRSDKDWRGL
jgi:hypothetical protein